MSVRSSLLAILTMGPAYGFQLHGELQARTAGRRSVNVGQIYSTLERLVVQGGVESAGSTPDGLPLYRLTEAGRAEALGWLQDTASSAGAEWNDMLDRVLIASSLAHVDLEAIISRYRQAWLPRSETAGSPAAGSSQTSSSQHCSGQHCLALAADRALAAAALGWLDSVTALLQSTVDDSVDDGVAGDAGPAAHPHLHRDLNPVRPKRGRRPAAATH